MKKIVITFLFIFVSFFSIFLPFNVSLVHAETNNSNVCEELLKDNRFNVNNYPDNPKDYSLQVIQVGISNRNELYLYVYQPAHKTIDLKGIKVNIFYGFSHNGIFEEGKIKPYDLELVSTEGVFDKYLVKNFSADNTFATDGEKYVNIISISREFNELIDTDVQGGDTVGISYNVGQQWRISYVNDKPLYEMTTFNTVEINTNLIGSVKLMNGLTWGDIVGIRESQQAWFYVFEVPDYNVNHIFDADINFQTRFYRDSYNAGPSIEGELSKPIYRTLTDKEHMEFIGKGLWGKEITWDRIQKGTDFIEKIEKQGCMWLTGDKEKITESSWVFSFYETPYETYSSYDPEIGISAYFEEGYTMENFSVLRLHFQTPQGTYNLGTVADIVNFDKDSIIVGGGVDLGAIEEFLEKILMIIGLVLLFVIVGNLIGVLSPLLSIITFALKGVIFIITLPFKLISKLFRSKQR